MFIWRIRSFCWSVLSGLLISMSLVGCGVQTNSANSGNSNSRAASIPSAQDQQIALNTNLSKLNTRAPSAAAMNTKLCASQDLTTCQQELIAIQPETSQFYLLVDVSALPEGTKLQTTLIYLEGPQGRNIQVVSSEGIKGKSGNLASYTFTKPKKGWPLGTYEAVVSMNGSRAASKQFSVKP